MGSGNGTTETAIAVRTQDHGLNKLAFEPSSLDHAKAMANELVKSGLMPSGLQKVEAALTIMVLGRELGLSVMQSIRGIHVIEGKPSISASLMVALVINSGKAEYVRFTEMTSKAAACETRRVGDDKPSSIRWTLEDAQRAGLTGKSVWQKYPGAMLRARCSAELMRAVYPDVILGLYDPDELENHVPGSRDSEPRDITPTITEEPPDVAPRRQHEEVTDAEVEPVVKLTTEERRAKARSALDDRIAFFGEGTILGIIGRMPTNLREAEAAVKQIDRVHERRLPQNERGGASSGVSPPDPQPGGAPPPLLEVPKADQTQQPGQSANKAPDAAQREPANGNTKATTAPRQAEATSLASVWPILQKLGVSRDQLATDLTQVYGKAEISKLSPEQRDDYVERARTHALKKIDVLGHELGMMPTEVKEACASLFDGVYEPADLSAREVGEFLSHLGMSAAAQLGKNVKTPVGEIVEAADADVPY